MTTLKVGIASYDEMKARTMAVVRASGVSRSGEPKVWFTSTECSPRSCRPVIAICPCHRREGAGLARRVGAHYRQGQVQSVAHIEDNGRLRACPP
jgi:hypothetical protein